MKLYCSCDSEYTRHTMYISVSYCTCSSLIQSPTTSSPSAQSTAETASEVDSTTDNYSTLIDSVDETALGTYTVFLWHCGGGCMCVCICMCMCDLHGACVHVCRCVCVCICDCMVVAYVVV